MRQIGVLGYSLVMNIWGKSAIAAAAAIGLIMTTAPATQALPSKFQKQLASAKKTTIGTPVKIAVPSCPFTFPVKYSKCKFPFLQVTVTDFSYLDAGGWPDGTSRYNLTMKIENFSNGEAGLMIGPMLRCSNNAGDANYYADGWGASGIPGKSEDSGTLIMSFPGDISASACKNPTIWLEPQGSMGVSNKKLNAEMKKKKVSPAAYISIPAALVTQ
jgi:hypothetical protein